jgi:N-acetylglucosaminyl-diphospho-decaprenol L-rhamnosyltransferase
MSARPEDAADGGSRRVAVVIVTHNSAPEIGGCLDALAGCSAEVLVVDNASSDGTAELVRRRAGVRLLENAHNRGFAAAVNQGIAATEADFVLLLNPDAVLVTGLSWLEAECAREGVAAAGGKLVDAGGEPQLGFMVRRFPTAASLSFEALGINRLWPANPLNRRYRCLDLAVEQPAEVEQPAGAFLMLRREAWQRLGGLDERFHPLWFEDVDFLRRATAAGYSVRYQPAAQAVHEGGHSVRRLGWERKQLYWYGNLLKYAARHFGRRGLTAVCLAVVLGSILRMLSAVVRSGSLGPIGVYATVVRVAARFLLGATRGGATFSHAFAVQ